MKLPTKAIIAKYGETIGHYQGNPFIEALPPIREKKDVINLLRSRVEFKISDRQLPASSRIHLISQLLNNFFHPIARHIDLETKISILIREGYVGRNISTGDLNQHIQNSYERTITKDISALRFDTAKSTAQSLSFIGCSGSGKTTTTNRILSGYPQVLYHPEHNFLQIVYLKIDCPHDGSLKSLCLHFFRAIDVALDTDYEEKYASKRHGIETLLHLMRHIANLHAIGLLLIDEIQHLSINKSGGADKMLSFFVTLVNVVGLPVIMVGTPKARFIFENDLRSARRGAGLGSILWEPMLNEPDEIINNDIVIRSEWNMFTAALWKYQWLNKADVTLSQEIRDCWYELSQGILDIAIKLFVLAQIKAISSKVERITVKLLRQTYQDELKTIHPIIEALRSGDPNRIARYSDLTIPSIDKKLLDLTSMIDKSLGYRDDISEYHGHETATRLHCMLLELGYDSELLVPCVKRICAQYPTDNMQTLMPIIMQELSVAQEKPDAPKQKSIGKKPKTTTIKPKEWNTLPSNDLRFMFSQKEHTNDFYHHLKASSDMIFDIESYLIEMA